MFRSAIFTLGALCIAGSVSAQSMELSPTRVQMIGAERASTMTIRNDNPEPLNVQIRAMDWRHEGAEDLYSPSQTLLASPPQATLAPGESQVIRIVAENAPAQPHEQAFRLVIDQIPDEQAEADVGIRTVIRALVPVFITSSLQDRPHLEWQARRSGDGVILTATNSGPARDRLVGAAATVDGQPVGAPLEGYVLSQAERTWTLTGVPATARMVRISGEGDFGPVVADVAITP